MNGNIVFYNRKYLKRTSVCVSPDDRAFAFGDGAYEVVLCHHGDLFRATDHVERFNRSLLELQIDHQWEPKHFETVCCTLIDRNGLKDRDATVYLQVSRGASRRRHRYPEDTPPTVFASARRIDPINGENGLKGGSAVTTEGIRWGRCDNKSLNLIPNVMANELAWQRGVTEAIFVKEEIVTEGSHTNVFMVKDGIVSTHPADHHILRGVTRQIVFELCEALDIPIKAQRFTRDALLDAVEVFIAGTTTHILPLIRIDGVTISEKVGSVVAALRSQYFQLLV